jgi:hypothetical protein
MKVFAFLYYVTLVFAAGMLVYPVLSYPRFGFQNWSQYTFVADQFLLVLVITGPIVVLRRLGTALRVRLLFLLICLAGWFLFACSVTEMVRPGLVEHIPGVLLAVWCIAGGVLFLAGCFSVRDPMVRKEFRIQAWMTIAVALFFTFWSLLPENAIPVTENNWILRTALICVPVGIWTLPLMVLYYRRWKRGMAHEQIAAAVEALGT